MGADLAELYAVSRLFINFFQPSFKLKSKTRDGARVHKTYYAPMTPCDRLIGSPHVTDATKARLREQFTTLDPVQLLQRIRAAQQVLANHASGSHDPAPPVSPGTDVATFLSSLCNAWQAGEVRPTHRNQARATRSWRTRADPFEHAWPVIEDWLETDPAVTAKAMLERLAVMVPDAYAGQAQLRTLQRRVKQWRAVKAKDLILGHLGRSIADREGAASAAPSLSIREETTTSPG